MGARKHLVVEICRLLGAELPNPSAFFLQEWFAKNWGYYPDGIGWMPKLHTLRTELANATRPLDSTSIIESSKIDWGTKNQFNKITRRPYAREQLERRSVSTNNGTAA